MFLRPLRPAARRRARHGAAAVEFALTATIFFVLLFAIVDWGLYLYTASAVQAAAEAGAHAGAIVSATASPGPTEVAQSRATQALTEANLDAGAASVTAAVAGVAPIQTVDVTITLPFSTPVSMLGLSTPPTASGAMSAHLERP